LLRRFIRQPSSDLPVLPLADDRKRSTQFGCVDLTSFAWSVDFYRGNFFYPMNLKCVLATAMLPTSTANKDGRIFYQDKPGMNRTTNHQRCCREVFTSGFISNQAGGCSS